MAGRDARRHEACCLLETGGAYEDSDCNPHANDSLNILNTEGLKLSIIGFPPEVCTGAWTLVVTLAINLPSVPFLRRVASVSGLLFPIGSGA